MSLLTVREAATRLGVAYSTLKQWIYKGSVRTVQTKGGHHRIKEAEVDRLLAQQGNLKQLLHNSYGIIIRGGSISKGISACFWLNKDWRN